MAYFDCLVEAVVADVVEETGRFEELNGTGSKEADAFVFEAGWAASNGKFPLLLSRSCCSGAVSAALLVLDLLLLQRTNIVIVAITTTSAAPRAIPTIAPVPIPLLPLLFEFVSEKLHVLKKEPV